MPKKAEIPRVRNVDYTDREMLNQVVHSADATGWASSHDIGVACGFGVNGKRKLSRNERPPTPAKGVANRLAWMRDGGLLEATTGEDGQRRWRMTKEGEQILRGKVAKGVISALERMNSGAQVQLMSELVQSGYVNGSTARAFALRRMYQHDIAKRRLRLR